MGRRSVYRGRVGDSGTPVCRCPVQGEKRPGGRLERWLWRTVVFLAGHQREMRSAYLTARLSASPPSPVSQIAPRMLCTGCGRRIVRHAYTRYRESQMHSNRLREGRLREGRRVEELRLIDTLPTNLGVSRQRVISARLGAGIPPASSSRGWHAALARGRDRVVGRPRLVGLEALAGACQCSPIASPLGW